MTVSQPANPKEILIVLTTCGIEAGASLANRLVHSGLAACVNRLPGVTSHYFWQGSVQTDEESLLLIKTTRAKYPDLEQEILQCHPYELPEIVAVPVSAGLENYLSWVHESVNRTR